MSQVDPALILLCGMYSLTEQRARFYPNCMAFLDSHPFPPAQTIVLHQSYSARAKLECRTTIHIGQWREKKRRERAQGLRWRSTRHI